MSAEVSHEYDSVLGLTVPIKVPQGAERTPVQGE
jgi:hypothetical protein